MIAVGDTPISIAKANNLPVQDLMAANPGVVTFRPGQVVSIPPSFAGAYGNERGHRGQAGAQGGTGAGFLTQAAAFVQDAYSPSAVMDAFSTPETGRRRRPNNNYTGTAGYYGQAAQNQPVAKTGGGYMPSLVPVQNPYAGYTGTAGYWGAFNQQQASPALQAARAAVPTPQPSMGSPSYMDPRLRPQPSNLIGGDKQGQLGASTQAPAMLPTDAKGNVIPYTGNPNDPNTELWKKYWDDSARAGVDLAGRPGPSQVMSRDQIWEMKAAQRRRQSASMGTEGGGYDAFSYDTQEQGIAPELVRNITWGI